MNLYASALAGEIGFGIFVVASLVLIVFVIRFANSVNRKGRNNRP